MVAHPAEYAWSSYRCNAQSKPNALIIPHPEYLALGSEAYRELFRYQLEPGLNDEMRKSLNHELVVGSSRFKEEIEVMTQRRVTLGAPGRPRKDG